MQIHLIAVGNKMPGWVTEGFEEYRKRLPRECELVLREVAPGKRGKNADLARIQEEEGERVLGLLDPDDRVIALEVGGKPWTTEALARELGGWMQDGRRVALLVGGPEGHSEAVRRRAPIHWSLSPLTLPHPLVRVLLAEQIYRAHSILKNHPYHR
jgi:23S rRNA (pseudouridine1915-N3)-methyltransferase